MRDVSKSFMEPVVGKQAACATTEPELFFPLYTVGGNGELHEALAKQVCQRCPIRNECLEFALHTGDDWAILGGMTPAERRALKRRNRPPVTFIPLDEAA
jgi:WhiB family redox-sensing transcriptional regulator